MSPSSARLTALTLLGLAAAATAIVGVSVLMTGAARPTSGVIVRTYAPATPVITVAPSQGGGH